jgi:hypothetical protein
MPNDMVIELWHHGAHWSLKRKDDQNRQKGEYVMAQLIMDHRASWSFGLTLAPNAIQC